MKSRKNRMTKRPGLSMQRLESRQMMAGDVSAYMENGNLYVLEAAGQAGAPNAVEVSQLTNGMVRVKGALNQGGSTTLVNGQTFRDFSIPTNSQTTGHLVVNLGGGNDSVTVGTGQIVNRINTISINTASPNANDLGDADFVRFNRVNTRGGSNIFTGSGTDNVVIDNSYIGTNFPGYFAVNAGEGNDSVRFFGLTTKGNVNVLTAGGNDHIDVSSSTIGDGVGVDILSIYAGAGADTINFNTNGLGLTSVRGHVNIYAHDNIAENDADTVDVRSTFVLRSINASMGGGNDTLAMRGVFAGDDIGVYGGAGNDTFNLTDVRAADDFYAYLGEGNDVLNMEYVGADELVVDGEGGTDRFSRWNNDTVRNLVMKNWETINGVTKVTRDKVAPLINAGEFATFYRA